MKKPHSYAELLMLAAFSSVYALVIRSVALAETGPVTSAQVDLKPTDGGGASGSLSFKQSAGKVKIEGEIRGLTPGKHGFHVHEKGDCGGEKAAAAGSHFNPSKGTHGSPSAAHRHAGDLGNIEAGADGVAHVSIEQEALSLNDEHSIVGRSVVVHAKMDDLVSQPAGDSGDRVACGVIQAR